MPAGSVQRRKLHTVIVPKRTNLGFMLFDGRLGVCVMARARCIVQFSWAGTLACLLVFFFTFDVKRANNQTLNGTWHVVTLCLLPSLLLYNPRKRACVRACFVTGLLKWQIDETPAAILWVSRAAGATSRAG